MNYELAKKRNYPRTGGYQAIHIWLRKHFGKANSCEAVGCEHKSKKFEWALIKGKTHDFSRFNYVQLCKPCHTKYDEINRGSKSYLWKGGKPKCKNCYKELSTYKNKTSLCGLCNRKLNPPWLGKSRSNHKKHD